MLSIAVYRKIRDHGVIATVRAIRNRLSAQIIRIFPSLGPHDFLTKISGVIHVGAHFGEERELYAKEGLKVLWIEALPSAFEQLRDNIRGFPKQRALNYLVTDKDDVQYTFHVTNNEGASSSILALARHREIWPDVHYVSEVTLKSITLDSLLRSRGDVASYQALVMDTQGSELLVLKGATNALRQLMYIKTEAADFESYVDCARVEDLTKYLARFGYKLIRSDRFATGRHGGQYFDLLYRKSRSSCSQLD
jgi:FkbM family methyltransferase